MQEDDSDHDNEMYGDYDAMGGDYEAGVEGEVDIRDAPRPSRTTLQEYDCTELPPAMASKINRDLT